MKLLIITQKVDKNDPTLGFFHRWIEKFAEISEHVVVICLEMGEHRLPSNVKVLSLGKESGESNLKYIFKFYKYIWQERKNYNSVFVHMNQEYVLLGWKFWKLFGKKIFLWRNHAEGTFFTRLAVLFSNKVFYTSPQSFTARFKKAQIMPVGIDTNFFKPDSSVQKKPNSILFLGRISRVKNVELFIDALKDLKVDFFTTIAGGSAQKDIEYEKIIRNKISNYGPKDRINFFGVVNQEGALRLYREHVVYVNLTPAGSMDKTIFEALSVGLRVVSMNPDVKKMFSGVFDVKTGDRNGVAQAIKDALSSTTDTSSLQKSDYSLDSLMKKLEPILR